MKYKLLAVVLPLLASAHSSMAQVYEKSGLPCVAEICIGEGLSELAKVKWDRAKNSLSLRGQSPQYIDTIKIDDFQMKRIQSRYKGDIGQSAPFLAMSQYDNGSLSGLSRITASCESGGFVGAGLKGTYTTQSGNPTEVEVALIPANSDITKQIWTVISITRKFPAAISKEQITEVKTELKQRYSVFSEEYRKYKMPKLGEAQFNIHESIGMPFYMTLRLYRGNDEDNRLKLHPACGGSAKVKLD